MCLAGISIYGVNVITSGELKHNDFFYSSSAFGDGVFAITKPQLKESADYISLSLQKRHHIEYLFVLSNAPFILHLTVFLQNPTLSPYF